MTWIQKNWTDPLASVERFHEMVGAPVKAILDHLGLPLATYYRWQHRRSTGSLTDRTASSQRRMWQSIPQKIDSAYSYALEYPQIGYKRPTWSLSSSVQICDKRHLALIMIPCFSCNPHHKIPTPCRDFAQVLTNSSGILKW